VGVIVAAAIIFWRPQYSVVDPLCTFTFSLIVFIVTMSIVRDCLRIIMEATPKGIDVPQIKLDFLKIKGVITIHDLHVWALTQNKNALTVHIESRNPD
jgi:cation diffusion facilitator family transporter